MAGPGARLNFDQKLPSTHCCRITYSGLDVLVLPSVSRSNWKEQFGRVLIEAMACDVILSALAPARFRGIGDAGLTLTEGSVEEAGAHLPAPHADVLDLAKSCVKKVASGSPKIDTQEIAKIQLKSTPTLDHRHA